MRKCVCWPLAGSYFHSYFSFKSPFLLQVSYSHWPFCDLISSHSRPLSACCSLATSSLRQVLFASVRKEVLENLVTFRSHPAFCSLVLLLLSTRAAFLSLRLFANLYTEPTRAERCSWCVCSSEHWLRWSHVPFSCICCFVSVFNDHVCIYTCANFYTVTQMCTILLFELSTVYMIGWNLVHKGIYMCYQP